LSYYKTIFTKTLQVKINIFFINIYLKKLVQKLIIIINIKELKKIIDIIILYICNNLIFRKREYLLKLRLILLQFKRK